MGSKIDNVLAVRMGIIAIKNLTHLKYPSKKKTRDAITVIEKAFEGVVANIPDDENPLIRDTDDQEIKYFMIVNDIDGHISDSWKEELRQHAVPAEIEEKYMREQAEDIINGWNENATSRGVKKKKNRQNNKSNHSY